jgi:NADH:ubiquinone oxidoreductase subunit C
MNIKNLSLKIPVIYYTTSLESSVLFIPSYYLLIAQNYLKKNIEHNYTLLSCISGIDFLSKNYRFCVVYELLSILYNTRLRLKCFIYKSDFIESCTNIYCNGGWWEREIWDFFGIYFNNNVDLRRILTDYGFEGFPMKKDFPLTGFLEFQYNSDNKSIAIVSNELSQEFRFFSHESYWN